MRLEVLNLLGYRHGMLISFGAMARSGVSVCLCVNAHRFFFW